MIIKPSSNLTLFSEVGGGDLIIITIFDALLKCFYTAFEEKKEWLSPKEIDLHYFKDEKNEILLNAFEKHFS
ncbi:MAG: hypothetical protein PHI32_04650, partial [Dysgonamonadaceae bacterium]|nr:hypothetical protein [Dysgonamonadaceae bacterium]